MRSSDRDRWILAFDGSCCRCRSVADRVEETGNGKLDVMPLTHSEVEDWRKRALGDDAPFVPTLIRVRTTASAAGEDVHAWTGLRMVPRLVRNLGLQATLRLLGALGEMRNSSTPASGGDDSPHGIGRAQFLRLTGLGVAAAMLGGNATAHAGTAVMSEAQTWVASNKGNLPRNYAAFTASSMAIRKAVYEELRPDERRQLWRDHLRTYHARRASMTDDQRAVLDRAIELADKESLFSGALEDGLRRELDTLGERAVAAFGKEEARAMLATLGPAVREEDGSCDCNTNDTWGCDSCLSVGPCATSWCTCTGSGCGWFWSKPCNGRCDA
jgi:hypothetical protein